MRRSALVTALTAALAFAALATGAHAHPPRGVAADARASALASVLAFVADAGDGAARGAQAVSSSANSGGGGGGGSSNVVDYNVPVRRTRRAAYALACGVVAALLLIAFAIWRRIRSRAHGLN